MVISKPSTLRRLRDLHIELHVQKHFFKGGVVEKEIDTGPVSVSSVELTALDVLTYESACGGFDNVCLVVNDLHPRLDAKKLIALGKGYPVLSSFQRLGFLLECLEARKELLQPLREWMQRQRPSPVLLLPSTPRKGKLHPEWKVVENMKVELEL